jgi:hypothetical protein
LLAGSQQRDARQLTHNYIINQGRRNGGIKGVIGYVGYFLAYWGSDYFLIEFDLRIIQFLFVRFTLGMFGMLGMLGIDDCWFALIVDLTSG